MNVKSIFEDGDKILNLRGIFQQIHERRQNRRIMECDESLSERLLDYLDSCLNRFVLKERLFLRPDMSLSFLADKLHTNRTYVSLAVHNLYGVRFREFINVLRVEYSKNLLKTIRLDLGHVATACGFIYASQFTKTFTEVEGVNPSQWRHMFFHLNGEY